MAARVPGKYMTVGKIEPVDELRISPGMLVAAMEEEDGAIRGHRRPPVAVK
jgi:hypothetical protein